ncbi:hypothetical protein [Chryseobacterium indologenes]|uniref:hypothetical protein n=1 Tax=Chryseobacterium indologenes TaxID=253 RepID=UPI003017E4C6
MTDNYNRYKDNTHTLSFRRNLCKNIREINQTSIAILSEIKSLRLKKTVNIKKLAPLRFQHYTTPKLNSKKVIDFLLEKRKGAKEIKIVLFLRTQENQRFSARLFIND